MAIIKLLLSPIYFLDMAINLIKAVLLITAVQFILGASCNKDNPRQCSNSYVFQATSEWSPQQETYVTGDTLYLTSTIPKMLTDQINTSIVVDYSNSVGIGGDLSIIFLDSIARLARPGKDSFAFVSVVGTFIERNINREFGINILYVENATNYQFKGAIICKKKGMYGIGVQNLKSIGLRGKNCSNANFEMTVINTQKNLSIWENALNITIDNDGKRKGFAFRVQ